MIMILGFNIFISPQLGNSYTTLHPLLWGLQQITHNSTHNKNDHDHNYVKVNSSHYAQDDKSVYTNQLQLTACAIISYFNMHR